MTLNEYQEQMRRTYKPGRKPNHGLGITGEVAEVAGVLQLRDRLQAVLDGLDAMRTAGSISERIKKDDYHKRIIDRDALRSELGDLQWYIAAVALDYDMTLDEIATENLRKLLARYPGGFVTGGGIRSNVDVGSDIPGGGSV